MSWQPPRKTRVVEWINAAGRGLRAAGVPLARLDERSLLEAACKDTGLSDFGDDWFREPLRLLLDSLERDAHLTLMGRVIARRDTLRILENRLRMVDVRARHPEIDAEDVGSPLFILGLPRTGTTILHELLAQDPANRAPLTWECEQPWPPPERATFETDPRIDEVERRLSEVERLIPDFKRMHRMGARLPQECAVLMQSEFASMISHTQFRVPRYQAWLQEADLAPVYASHRRQLQILQWRCRGERWVLKTPQHLWHLEALLTVYPDARIVQTHRDPLRVVASLTSLVSLLRSMSSDRVDPLEIGADWAERLHEGLHRTMAVRDRGVCRPEQVVDLPYHALMRDPLGAIRGIYEHFGLALSDTAETRMRRYLADNPRDKHGAHVYALEFAGLDPSAERRRFAAYQERYGLEPEPV
jgi:hypothetical protein